MKQKCLMMVALGAILAAAYLPALAHHGAAAYDTDKIATVKGTVMRWIWSNPHCLLFVDATDDASQVAHWILEVQNPLSMTNMGWTGDSFKPGDHVTIRATPAKNGKPIGLIIDAVTATGQKLNARNIIVSEPTPDATPKQ